MVDYKPRKRLLKLMFAPIRSAKLPRRAAVISFLYRWTCNSSIGAVHATITSFRFKQCITPFTIIKPLTGIGWHCLGFSMSTLRASNIRIRYYCFCFCCHSPYPAIKMKMPMAGSNTASLYNTPNNPVKPKAPSVIGNNGVRQHTADTSAPAMPIEISFLLNSF